MNPLDNIKVVLVGTLYTGNVGSACRAMANMGFHHLVLAAPNLQNSWDEASAWRCTPPIFSTDGRSSPLLKKQWRTALPWSAPPLAEDFTAST